MWSLSYMLVVIFLFVYLFKPSTSSGRVSVHLLEYHRSSDTGCNGSLFSSNPCDLMFTVCFKGLSGKDSCTKTSDQYKGTRDVAFGTNINGGIANPILKSFTTLQTGAEVEVKVDDDYWLSSTPLPLDDLKTPLPPFHNGGTVNLTDSNARLTLTITVTCDPHYYGPNCSVLCNPGSADHYTCDPDGLKHCIKGYTGSACQQTPCHNVACHNGGMCVLVGSTFNCSCPSGFSGVHCETTPCTKNPCQNQGTCHVVGSIATCSCKAGSHEPMSESRNVPFYWIKGHLFL
ncbi:delta-like protein 4 [Haliotis rubra]|uniref:delta-like protein 4 n=1 Tax=Haliotis rubra TaxID=36100 RepID=UPI001EE5FE49|nr:delta-like protein 4 [Haliotis rubra]